MRRALVLTILLVAASWRPANGQQISLEQAVEHALVANPGIRAAEAAVDEAAGRVGQAKAGYLPRVNVVESWQRGDQPVYVFGSLLAQRRFSQADLALDRLNHPEPVSNHRAAIAVEQTVFDGLRTQALVRAAELGRTMARTGVARTRGEIVLAVTEAYGQGLLAAAGSRAARAAVSAAEEDLRLAERRRDAGIGTEADVLSLAVHLAAMRERLIRMESDERVALATLNRLMGDPLDQPLTLADVSLETGVLPGPIEALEQQALRDRPEAQQGLLAIDLAAANRRTARGGFIPVIAFQGVYELNGQRFGTRASSWTVGAEMRWNIFAGGANRARLQEASGAAARAQAERDRTEGGIRLEVRSAAAGVEAARARVDVGQAAVAQARESQRIIRDRYDAGLASVNDVLRAANALLEAESLRIGALVDFVVSRAALDRALGVAR